MYRLITDLVKRVKSYSLIDQIERAALSIVLNIAEGSAKKSDKEFARFIQISLGSVSELVACLDLMKDNKMITDYEYREFLSLSERIAKQLGGFSKKFKSSVNS